MKIGKKTDYLFARKAGIRSQLIVVQIAIFTLSQLLHLHLRVVVSGRLLRP